MALSKPLPMPVRTKEDTNFLRLADLVIRVSPRAVRTQFDKHFNPGGLQIFLNQIKTKLEALQKKRVIHQSQMDILYPQSGTTQVKSSDMDVPLMLVLFRNFTLLKLRDTLPPSTDTSEGGDLSRIRHYRNFVAHSADGKIDDSSFSPAWKEICEAIQRLGGHTFKDECDTLLVAALDNSYRDVYLNFIHTERRLIEVEKNVQKLQLEQKDTVPSNIRGLMSDEINAWETDNTKFYVTSATTAIKEIVKTNPFVVITGSPGMGKSATARHIALSLMVSDKFEILPVERPGEIIKYFKTDCSQIFLIDDICGKFCAETNVISKWEKSDYKLKEILRKTTSLRIIGTCRLQIFYDGKVQNIGSSLGMKECDLTSIDFKMSTKEKRKIATCHCDENIVSQLSDDIVNKFDMFPLLCATFSHSETIKSVDFFKHPYETFEQELKEMQCRNEDCFVGLVLLVIFNNKVKLELFKDRKNKHLDRLCDEIFEICELTNKPVKHHVLSSLQTLHRTYTNVSHSAITAVHDTIFDIMSFYIGSHFIELILEHGSSRFICNRIQLESFNIKHNEYTIMLKSEFEDMFFRRILTDVKLHRLGTVFNNDQMKHKTFQEKFLSSLSRDSYIQSVFINNQWSLIGAAYEDKKLIVDFIVDKLNKQRILKVDKHSNKEYVSGVYYSDTSDEEINEYITFSKQKDSSFIIAAGDGNTNIMDILLENFDIDVNSVVPIDSREHTALTNACSLEKTDTVSVLVNKYNCDVNLKCDGYSPLHFACLNEYPDIVDILLSAKCDVNARDMNQKTPLFIACENGNPDVVRKLLHNECDANLCESNGLTPINVAREKGYKEIEQLLQSYICLRGDISRKRSGGRKFIDHREKKKKSIEDGDITEESKEAKPAIQPPRAETAQSTKANISYRAADDIPYMEPHSSGDQVKKIYETVVENSSRRARSKSLPDLYISHGKSAEREWFFKLKLFCDDKYDVHVINSHGIEKCYPCLEKYVDKKGQLEMVENPTANEDYTQAFEAIYKEKMGLTTCKDDYVRNNFDLACRFMLSKCVYPDPLKDMLIRSMEKQISCIAKAASWCLLKNLLHVQKFLPVESLAKVEDIWPGFCCHCTKKLSKGHSKICSTEAMIIIEVNEHIKDIKKDFMGIKIVQSCSGQMRDSKKTSKKTTCEPIKNTEQQPYSKLSGEIVELFFKKYSKLTIIYISPDFPDYVQLYCQIRGVIPMGEDHFPKQICEFGTNVTEGHVNFMAQIRIGDGIGHRIGTAQSGGTLGGFVQWQGLDTFLTCAHVFYDRKLLSDGSKQTRHKEKIEVFLHGTGGSGQEICGNVIHHVFEHSDSSQTSVDAALVLLTPNIVACKDDIISDGTLVQKKYDFLGMQDQYINYNFLCIRKMPQSGTLKARSVGMVSRYFEDYIKYVDYDFEDREPGIWAEFSGALQEETNEVMASNPQPPSTAVTVHFQKVIIQKVAKRYDRTGARFYHQLSIENLPFKGGDSGTCIYIVNDQSAAGSYQQTGCLGMAIASFLDERNKLNCIVTPTEAILKRLGLL